MRRPIRAPEQLVALALVAALAGCAKKGPPSGGPPDLIPPTIVEISPDSGAAGVSTHANISVTFSEGMEPRTTNESFDLSPPIPIRQWRWSGRTVTLVLRDTLKADHTYSLYIGSNARDRHGNALGLTRTVMFTTAQKFPPGRIEGHVDAVGFKVGSTNLWLYRDGRQPDSTARDFDAIAATDVKGDFRVSGLAVPAKWRVWGFADLNRNRSFEPASDLLVALDSTLDLNEQHPVASGLVLHMLNPAAPGRFAGTVLDSVTDQTGPLRLIVTTLPDTTRRVVYEVPSSGSFDFQWDPARYRVRAYRDTDGNRGWKRDTEPASEEIEVTIRPGGEITDAKFVLVRPQGGAPKP
jgi:predicted small lipoprotein YifL